MPTAEIIAIGTELLLGETADTNTRFIARVLRSLGIDLFRAQTIGDNAGRITESIHQALERADIIITTGGLGPTVDDPTRQAVADVVGSPLEYHPELWDQITARITRYGRKPTENQKRQAYIPRDAVIIENTVGTAPAFVVEIPIPAVNLGAGDALQKKVIVSLPGVPREMETLLTEAVVPYLRKNFHLNSVLKIRTLHVSGLGEGAIDDKMGDLETLVNPTVGLAAHSGLVDIRLAAKAGTETEADQMIAVVEEDLRTRLGENIFGSDDSNLEGVTLDLLAQKGWTLACLEINLEGKLINRLEQVGHPAFRGGQRLEIKPEDLSTQMTSFARQVGATAALGVVYTCQDEKQEVFNCLISPRGTVERHLSYGGHPGNARGWVVNMALDWLRRNALEDV
jgi:competence/damage-inducible protein CinA-like protein